MVLTFGKKLVDDRRVFSGPTSGLLRKDDAVLVLDDHTSGGYTKSLFIDYLESLGAHVTDVLTVVDREQGAEDFLKTRGVNLHRILTLSQMLDYYQDQELISKKQVSLVRSYISQNQINL